MTSLTKVLDSPDAGKRIIGPASAGKGFLGGLADLGTQGLEAWGHNRAQSDKLENESIQSQIEGKVTDLRRTATEQIRTPLEDNPAIDEHMSGLPSDVIQGAKDLDKTRRAVEQGRAAQSQMDMGLENFVSTMEAKYPDKRDIIGSYMRDQHFDHYLWREQALQDKLQLAGEQGQVEGYAATVKKAMDAGYGALGLNNDQLYKQGARLEVAEKEASAAAQAATAARADVSSDEQHFKFLQEQSDRNTLSATTAAVNADYGPLLDHLSNVANSTDSEDAAYERFQKMSPEVFDLIDKKGRHYIQRLQAAGTPESVVKAAQEQIDLKKKAVEDIYFSDRSRFAQKNRAYQNMKTTLSVSDEQALPFYMMAKRVMGPGYLEAIFGGSTATALSPELTQKVKEDLLHYDPTRVNSGLNIIAQIGALTQGNASLADVPEKNITGDYVKGLNVSAVRYREHIEDPAPDDPSDYKGFLGSVGNLTIAAMRIQPGYKDLNALDYATGSIISTGNQRMLDKLIKDPSYKNQALPIFMATRGSAAQILEVARAIPAPDSADGQKLELRNGSWIVKGDPRAIQINPGSIRLGYRTSYSIQGANTDLVKQADIMNKTVDYLVQTAPADPQLKGYSEAELRAHYTTGAPLKPKAEGAAAPGKINPQAQLDGLERELHDMSQQVEDNQPFLGPDQAKYEPVAHEAAGKIGVPLKGASWFFGQESGWNPSTPTNIDNNHDGKPDSTAKGIGQFINGAAAKKYGLMGDGFDYRLDPFKAIPASLQYLKDLSKKNGGDWVKALHEYGTLARSNFKSDEDYNRTVTAARAAFEG